MTLQQKQQLTLDWPVRPAMGREDFMVAACNEDAVGWIDRWPDWPAPALVLYGPTASGKTHLAHVWQQQANALWADGPEDTRLHGHIIARGAVCLDINGGVDDETALFHLYNHARDHGGTILLTGQAPASAWNLSLADLGSRLNAAPNVGLLLPDDALLGALLVKLFADRQLEVDPSVLNYLLSRMERSFAAAGDMVDRLDKAALAAGRAVTVPFARQVLEQMPPD